MNNPNDSSNSQIISFITDPNPKKLDALLDLLPTLMADDKQRSKTERALRIYLRYQQRQTFRLNAQSPSDVE